MTNQKKNPYESSEVVQESEHTAIDIVSFRKSIVPGWIKFFGWLFMIMGVFAPLAFIVSLATGSESSFTLFGLESTGSSLSVASVLINGLLLILGVSAFGLLFGKSWGLKACLFSGYLGLVVVVISTVLQFSAGNLTIRLEPLIQIPYLIKLHKMRAQWKSA